ncbi:hypothetical protein J437_LFUL012664 [Ladona fulva]|uniref:Uncharacterized protein n=1 Tax=Ladona fulva TaxID=123851 RepID=A0A8K0KFQ8_LADFU|nr:hypothetical protein J437_LFUL012664 [Ladona fulva]
MLKVLGRVSIDLSVDMAKVLESFLLNKISEFSLPFSAIRPAVDALYLMSRQVEGMPPSESSGFVPVWGVPLIHSCEQFITSAFHARPGNAASGKGNQGRKKNQSSPSIDEEALARYMLTFADVSLICPGVVKKMTIATIQTILFPKNSYIKDHQIPPSPKSCSVAVVVLGKLCLQDARLAARIVPSLGSLLQKPPLPHPPPSDKAWAPLRNNVI